MMEPVRWTGTVARWNGNRGFGFLKSENAGEGDVFLHASEWHDPLPIATGMRVSFTIGKGPDGRLRAKSARAI